MNISLLYPQPCSGAGQDDLDVITQAKSLADACTRLGHTVHTVPFTLDLAAVAQALRGINTDMAFNLVEGVDGKGKYIPFAPALLEDMGLAFTGAGGSAMALSSNKLFAKSVLSAHNIPTPAWRSLPDLADGAHASGTYIIKSVWEHASKGMGKDCVVSVESGAKLLCEMRLRAPDMGGECFAEAYVEGREFNISILEAPTGPRVLPPAEMLFDGRWLGPRIVGYLAKWADDSEESRNTRRSFVFSPDDLGLLQDLEKTALECWAAFDLCGYARVDFRVDQAGGVQVIDVNANPCLSPDSGFRAALAKAQIPFQDAVQCILTSGLKKKGRAELPPPRPAETGPGISQGLVLRKDRISPEDEAAVVRIAESSRFFSENEVRIAAELVRERINKGPESGYFFLFAESGAQTVGFACYGPTDADPKEFELYWIAVLDEFRDKGVGRLLLRTTEELIQQAGGERVSAETSSSHQYAPTRIFYEAMGFCPVAITPDFYAPGEHKYVYVKELTRKTC